MPQLLGCGEAIEGARGDTGFLAVVQGADSYLKELVEIRGIDRDELQSLEQRNRRFSGQPKNSFIEVEPTKFTIDENRRHIRDGTRVTKRCFILDASGTEN